MSGQRLKCGSYDEFQGKHKTIREGFSCWCYSAVTWSDFADEVPPLSGRPEDIEALEAMHSDVTPQSGQTRTVKVTVPFRERIGNEFYMEYRPKSYHQFEHRYSTPEDCEGSAIVRCRFTEILASNREEAWIRVLVLDVTMFPQLLVSCETYETDRPLVNFGGLTESRGIDLYVPFSQDPWKVIVLSAQGDVVETKTIYTDENGVNHLILMCECVYGQYLAHFGNIISTRIRAEQTNLH